MNAESNNDIQKIFHKKLNYMHLDIQRDYLYSYKLDLLITILIFLFFIILVIIYALKNSFPNYVKKLENCNPIKIPFMDIFFFNNKKEFLDKSQVNFNTCVQNILKPVYEKNIKSQNKSLNIINKIYNHLNKSILTISSILSKMRNNTSNNNNFIYNAINDTNKEKYDMMTTINNDIRNKNKKLDHLFDINNSNTDSISTLGNSNYNYKPIPLKYCPL